MERDTLRIGTFDCSNGTGFAVCHIQLFVIKITNRRISYEITNPNLVLTTRFMPLTMNKTARSTVHWHVFRSHRTCRHSGNITDDSCTVTTLSDKPTRNNRYLTLTAMKKKRWRKIFTVNKSGFYRPLEQYKTYRNSRINFNQLMLFLLLNVPSK